VSKDPIAENAVFEILAVLEEMFPNGMSEEYLYDQIVGHNGWEAEDVTNGLMHAETQGWIKRTRNRVSATPNGIEALTRSKK
jgi:hypothetical protein